MSTKWAWYCLKWHTIHLTFLTSCCRVGNYAKQQAYALQLQKFYPQKPIYPWWIAVASGLQARAAVLAEDPEQGLPSLVLLTARLMDRAWQRTPATERRYEMLLVYVDAMQAAGEYEAALKVWGSRERPFDGGQWQTMIK